MTLPHWAVPRRWGGPRMWRWFSINISDDVHFGGIRIGTEAGDLHRGWVWKDGEHTSLKVRGRHDPCVLPRAVPIVEAMCALVLADMALRHHALRI